MLKNILFSVTKNKCPKCHQGNIFVTNNVFNLRNFDKMHEKCSNCDLKFEKEPGFFYGAMFVSYALMAAWFVTTWCINILFLNLSTYTYLAFVLLTFVFLATITFRTSRIIWINFFTKFEGKLNKK